jgi:hypothetical protein
MPITAQFAVMMATVATMIGGLTCWVRGLIP